MLTTYRDNHVVLAVHAAGLALAHFDGPVAQDVRRTLPDAGAFDRGEPVAAIDISRLLRAQVMLHRHVKQEHDPLEVALHAVDCAVSALGLNFDPDGEPAVTFEQARDDELDDLIREWWGDEESPDDPIRECGD